MAVKVENRRKDVESLYDVRTLANIVKRLLQKSCSDIDTISPTLATKVTGNKWLGKSWMARPQPRALAIFKIVYWGTAIALAIAAFLMAPPRHKENLVDNLWILGFYFIFAGAVYRLLLLFACQVTGSDAVMHEIEDSEGRIELDLDDRKSR